MMIPYERKWLTQLHQGVERLEKGLLLRLPRIPEHAFRAATDEQRLVLLKEKFQELMTESSIKWQKNMLCPYHEDVGPSLKYFSDTRKFFCFARCFQDRAGKETPHKDALDLIGDLEGLTNYNDQYNRLVQLFVENPEQFYKPGRLYKSQKRHFDSTVTKKAAKPYKSVLAIEDKEVKAYLNKRGIDDSLIQLFHMQAVEDKGFKLASVPCDGGFEARRNVRFRAKNEQDISGKYLNPEGKQVHLFNSTAIKNAITEVPVFCVEAALDAIILKCLGVDAVAINGASASKLIEQVRQVQNPNLRLILLFDLDEAGRKLTDTVTKQLPYKNIIPVNPGNLIGPADYLKGFKDFGEAYCADQQKAKQAIDWLALMLEVRKGL